MSSPSLDILNEPSVNLGLIANGTFGTDEVLGRLDKPLNNPFVKFLTANHQVKGMIDGKEYSSLFNHWEYLTLTVHRYLKPNCFFEYDDYIKHSRSEHRAYTLEEGPIGEALRYRAAVDRAIASSAKQRAESAT